MEVSDSLLAFTEELNRLDREYQDSYFGVLRIPHYECF